MEDSNWNINEISDNTAAMIRYYVGMKVVNGRRLGRINMASNDNVYGYE